MLKVLYIVSTLERTGPTNQLLNIVRLNKSSVNSVVCTLSREPQKSMAKQFSGHAKLKCLDLTRLDKKAVSRVERLISELKPDVVHTQGIRADGICAKLNLRNWVQTQRNFPPIDYPMQYGWFKGGLMSFIHKSWIKKCPYPIACSESIMSQLKTVGISCYSFISNGVDTKKFSHGPKDELRKKMGWGSNEIVCVVSGPLIKRKNNSHVISIFEKLNIKSELRIVFVGDGPENDLLQNAAQKTDIKIDFLGMVNDVVPYLQASDIILSLSLGEGMPNAILEGVSCGAFPVMSDIPSHQVFYQITNYGKVLKGNIVEELEGLIEKKGFNEKVNKVRFESEFSAESMSKKYLEVYVQAISNQIKK